MGGGREVKVVICMPLKLLSIQMDCYNFMVFYVIEKIVKSKKIHIHGKTCVQRLEGLILLKYSDYPKQSIVSAIPIKIAVLRCFLETVKNILKSCMGSERILKSHYNLEQDKHIWRTHIP